MEQCSYKVLRIPVTLIAKEDTVCRNVTSLCLVVTYRRLRGNCYFPLKYSMFAHYRRQLTSQFPQGETETSISKLVQMWKYKETTKCDIPKDWNYFGEKTCCFGRSEGNNYFYGNKYTSLVLQDNNTSYLCLPSSHYVHASAKADAPDCS